MITCPSASFCALFHLALLIPFGALARGDTRDDENRRAVPDQVAPEVEDLRRTGPSAVRVSGRINGKTPTLIGYNMGTHLPANNVTAWLRYSEINAARHWWSQGSWPEIPAAWADDDNTLTRFERLRAELRANPAEGLTEIATSIAADQPVMPTGTLGLNYSLSELRKNGITTLVQLNQNTRNYPFERSDGSPDWHGRWSYWRGVYLNARYIVSTYGIERFQLFNEPDHPQSKHISQECYLQRMQIGSDALHAAIADVNRADGTELSLRLGAPVTAGLSVFSKRSGRPDERDLVTGWGELITRHRNDTFPGRSDAFKSLYNVYSFQSYGRATSSLSEGIPRLRSLIADANGGRELPLIATEMNVSTAANLAKTTETLDSPSYYAPFGAIAAAYVNAGIDEIYIFRLTQAPFTNGTVKKNGTHLVGLEDRQQNIVASTRTAEVARLFIRGFQGARARLVTPSLKGGLLQAAACLDLTDNTHYLLLTNLYPHAEIAPVDLSAWKLPPGSLITVEEVSSKHYGDVRAALALPTDRQLELLVSGSSVTLLSARPVHSGKPSATLPVATEAQLGVLTAPALPSAHRPMRVLLALRANPVVPGAALQVRAGAVDALLADVLGQFVPTADATERVVDITRYVLAHPDTPLVFQVVAEGSAASLPGQAPEPATVHSAELRIFGPR
jgi:hypothetical protein